MKTLVTYYSRTGNTKRVAEALAENLNADIEAIVSDTKDKGMGRLAMQDSSGSTRKSHKQRKTLRPMMW